MAYIVDQRERLSSLEQNRTTISSLPPELLLLIFEFCHEDFQNEEKNQPDLVFTPWNYISGGLDPFSMRPTPTSTLFDRFRSPSRFPFALAAVSPLWNDLLLMEPKYWTEIIYTLGSCASGADLVKTIQNSIQIHPHDQPLVDFIVLKAIPGFHSSVEIQDMENTQLEIIATRCLNSRFPFFRSISIETHTGESFPVILGGSQDSRCQDTSITTSILLTRDTQYTYQGHKYCQYFNQTYPSLRTLAIHGPSVDRFFPVILQDKEIDLHTLVVSDYTFSSDSLSFTEFLQILSLQDLLSELKLQNIVLPYTSEEISSDSVSCHVSQLHLESIPSFTMAQLYRLCNFPNLTKFHFTKSPYLAPHHPFPPDSLILDEIEVDPNGVLDFETRLGDWEGSALWIGRYPRRCKDFLDILGKYNKWTHEFRCPWMDTLYLYQIPDLSLTKLKTMLGRRNRDVNYGDPEWRTNTLFGPAVRKLSIDQCDVPPLTEQDVEWFSSMLVEFVYIP